MTYLLIFVFLFLSIYFVLGSKGSYLKLNIPLLISLFVAFSISFIFQNTLSKGSFELAQKRESLQKFILSQPEDRQDTREDVEDLIKYLSDKKEVQAGELYILAKQLKNTNEFLLSTKVFKEIYDRYGNELDGNVIAEYAQVLFASNGRKFNDFLEILLDESLKKTPNNPSALTLKGLSELEKNNLKNTIELWNRAIVFLNSEKEKNDLKALIEVVKKRKNQ
tara:strand:- start:623 stop:1288 length:666 start_codon:yes stop_codon:yes gene_type:complete